MTILDDLDALYAEIEEMLAELHARGENTAHYLWDLEQLMYEGNIYRMQDLKRTLETKMEGP